MADDIDRDGIDIAIKAYEQNQGLDVFHPVVETEINKLGYVLLGAERNEEAIVVLRSNAAAFPDSWNAFDSLGEAYLAAGNTGLARQNYEKSLALHPGNMYGIEALRKIELQEAQSGNSQTQDEQAAAVRNVSFASQVTGEEELTAGVDETIRQCMEQSRLPGVAIVIVKDGKTIFKRGYGFANVEQKTAVDPDKTLFRIGSISKALTLLTVARQIEEGRLKLDDDVTQFIDGINNISGGEHPVTIYNLLTHTSGFDQLGGSDRQVYDFQQTLSERKEMRPGIVDYLQANRLRRVSAPGEYFRYDTYGSTLAGAVLEKVTGLPYDQAMQQELFARVGMTRSFVEADAECFDDLATGYGFVSGEYVAQPYEVFVTTPASSIDATPADMGRLLEALTGGGANSHGRLFQQEMMETVLAPQFQSHPEFVGTTHGLFESYARSGQFEKPVRSVGHGGSMRGYIATLEVIPEHNLGIFLVTNRAPEAGGGNVHLGPVIEKVIGNIPDAATREPYPVPEPDKDVDLSEYVGDYYYGVFSHSGTPAEFASGSWPRGRSRAVTQGSGTLTISGDEYMYRGNDVFVRADGLRMVYFGRNEGGKVSFYLFSSSADTFERVED